MGATEAYAIPDGCSDIRDSWALCRYLEVVKMIGHAVARSGRRQALIVLGTVLVVEAMLPGSSAQAGDTGTTFTVSGGSLSISVPATANLGSGTPGGSFSGQLGTVQVDYILPIRFDLSYIGSDNQSHRPVMIHRAPFGSMERFCGVLIEHFAGDFPTWLPAMLVTGTCSS